MQPTTDHHARIVAAAEAVAARGENPTLTSVRAELGGGSFSTISPILRAWKATQARADEPVREPLPERIHEAAIAGAGELWRAALELASERLNAERAALDATRAELDEAVSEATATADELASQLEQTQSAAQSAAETAAHTEAELRAALDTEKTRADTAEQARVVAQALADERQSETDAARAHAQTAADTHAQELAALREELDTAQRQALATAERASAAEALADACENEIARAHELHRDLVARIEPAQEETGP